MSKTVIDGAYVLADACTFRIGSVAVDGGVVTAATWAQDERKALCSSGAHIVDGANCWLVPGLVNAHTHSSGTLFRGTESALPLELWALYAIAYGSGLDDEAISAAVLLHDAECIRSGITGIVDHFPYVKNAEAALGAHDASGLRVMLAAFVQDISDYDLLGINVPRELQALAAVAPVDIAAYESLFSDLAESVRSGSGRVQLAVGPNAPQRCSDDIWSMWHRLRDRHNVRVHTHALETRAQAHIALQRWPEHGMISAMDKAGLLDAGLSLAHAIWTTPQERERLAERGVAVSHNPLSNLTLGSGIMPLSDYLDTGITVGIGTDASNCAGRHDLFETMRAAMTLPRVTDLDPLRWPTAEIAFGMATTNGMRILGFNGGPGIRAGIPADLVLVRRKNVANLMFVDTIDGFVAQAGRESVQSVMIDGRWALLDNRLQTIDEDRLLDSVEAVHSEIQERTASAIAPLHRGLADIAAQLQKWSSCSAQPSL